jgi:hypothetical protein
MEARKAWTEFEQMRNGWMKAATEEVAKAMRVRNQLTADTAEDQKVLVELAEAVLVQMPAPRFTEPTTKGWL